MNVSKLITKTFFLICATAILFTACGNDESDVTMLDLEPVDTLFYSYLALGDSYTIGQGVTEAERWPVQLKEKLAEQDVFIDTLNIIAQTGWTTLGLLNNIETQQSIIKHDLVSLLIGVNDQFQSRPFDDFKMGFDTLLQMAIELAGGASNVFVVSIPDYGVTPFGSNNSTTIAAELDAYNAYMEGECQSFDIPFVNITEVSRNLENDDSALATDNLHPSGYQYGLWVEEMLPVVLDVLGE